MYSSGTSIHNASGGKSWSCGDEQHTAGS
jgi:hypothetical protein